MLPRSTYSPLRQVLGLAACLLLTFAAAAIGGLASVQAGSFYGQLTRPQWAPPPWLFGPVWSVLYLLMGVAAWIVWRTDNSPRVRAALAVFMAQLALNALWTWLFFVWRQGALAFAEIVLLWAAIALTIYFFSKVSKFAAALLAPYLAWVTFASALSLSLWRLNAAILS